MTVTGENAIGDVLNNVAVTNSGTISAPTFGFDGINLGNFNTVNTSGSITAARYAIYIFDSNTIINTGTLTADTGIYADGNNNNVTNSGTIMSICCGINLLSNNVVLNSESVQEL